jgi:hypothetical protein
LPCPGSLTFLESPLPEGVSLLQRVQKIMNSNVVFPKTKNVIFIRIGFVIQKGFGGTTPLIHM